MPKSILPESWRWIRLGDITEIVGGGTPPRNIERYFGGEIPWVTPTDITSLDSIYLSSTAETITQEGLKNSSAKLLPANAVLMTSRATIGFTAIATKTVATNQGFANFICNSKLIDSEYLARYLSSAKERLIHNAQGTTFKEISRGALSKFVIPLPTLPEQHEIVKILRLTDRLRQLRTEADKKAEVLALATFTEIFGHIVNNSVYRHARLGKVADVVSGVTKGRNLPAHETVNVPYLRVANVQAGYIDLSEIKTIDVLPSDVEKYALQHGDVLLTEGGDFDKLGRGAIWEHDLPNCIHQNHIFRVRVDRDLLLPPFFNYYLQTTFAKHYFLRAAKRTTNLASINMSQLNALPVPLPPMEEQEKFVNSVNQILSNLARQEQSKNEINRLSQAVMIEAFTGRLTQSYREQNLASLARLADERDISLKQPSIAERPTDEIKLAEKRAFVKASLSSSQRTLLTLVEGQDVYITNEDLEFASKLTPNEVRRNLDLLMRVGLVKAVNLAVTPGELGRIFFTKAYRTLYLDDEVREVDLVVMRGALEE